MHSSWTSLVVFVTSAMRSLLQAEGMLALAVTDFGVFRAVVGPLQCTQ